MNCFHNDGIVIILVITILSTSSNNKIQSPDTSWTLRCLATAQTITSRWGNLVLTTLLWLRWSMRRTNPRVLRARTKRLMLQNLSCFPKLTLAKHWKETNGCQRRCKMSRQESQRKDQNKRNPSDIFSHSFRHFIALVLKTRNKTLLSVSFFCMPVYHNFKS